MARKYLRLYFDLDRFKRRRRAHFANPRHPVHGRTCGKGLGRLTQTKFQKPLKIKLLLLLLFGFCVIRFTLYCSSP